MILTEDHYFIYLVASRKELEARVIARQSSQPHEASFYCYKKLLDEIVGGYIRCLQLISCAVNKDNLMVLAYDNLCDPSLASSDIINYISNTCSTASQLKK